MAQCVDDSFQIAINRLVYVEESICPEKRRKSGLILRMLRIACGPQMMPGAMGFAEIQHEQIPRAACEHGKREVGTLRRSLNQAVLEAAQLTRTLTKKITLSHGIRTRHLLNLLL
ncbi:MAG TPA: hypothetical protein VJ746_10285 [Nitrospira sp.]|nr:hypothetical protein [Nitrospira sp.]